ncbi:MAG: 50S ribosomal protein L25 [Alicyclobacillus sp.]|nr:50S ribosomal protein L25 [Alicyclobacillus sp.]
MEQVEMTAQLRTETSGAALRALRSAGFVPAVVYGSQMTPLAISVPAKWFDSAAASGKTLVSLRVNGQTMDVMVQDIQRDPVSRRVTHVDFYRVDMARMLDVRVPVHVNGSEEVERRGGIVQQQAREVEVTARPADAPQYISVDVSHLRPGDHITAGELVLPPQVTLKSDPAEVVVSILAPKQTVAFAEAKEAESV